ncbi:MAG: RnfABCDGE type electron transport complex subunit D [Tissierellia bacterium]|nr:RnfABCDGE type electron transport complex subunit D [Tissierellia bacterium]
MSFIEENFMKQKMMRTVLIALMPIIIFSVYFNGLRALILTIINIMFAFITEYLFQKKILKGGKVSEAVIVTAILYSMTLPVSIPIWMSISGIIFAVFFGKMVYGGFGRNVFNPALVGRAFVYINFPEPMTVHWNQVPTFSDFPGGFAKWVFPQVDVTSTATPMLAFRNEGLITKINDLLFGVVPGVMGETFKILIIIAAIYLIYKKVASWQVMLGCLIGFTGLTVLFNLMGVESLANPLEGILQGGFLFGSVFMATDPITTGKTPLGRWIFGILVGSITIIIRGFALFSGGMMFAILIANTFIPIVDYAVNESKKRKKAKQEVAGV